MKLQLWKIWVCDGWLAASHGMFHAIHEVYIPALGLALNNAGFHSWGGDRYLGKDHLEDNEFVLDHDWQKHQPDLLQEIEITDEHLSNLAQKIASAKLIEIELATSIKSIFADQLDS